MVDIPDVIISKPRKFAHDAFGIISGLSLIIGVINLLAGNIGTAILYVIPTSVFAHIASKIKFKWVLRQGVARYE